MKNRLRSLKKTAIVQRILSNCITVYFAFVVNHILMDDDIRGICKYNKNTKKKRLGNAQ